MIVGVIIGEFVPNVQNAFDTVRFHSVSVPIAIGLIVMMWPILTKVQYEALPHMLPTWTMLTHILISFVLNWLIGPFVMLGLAWATLPDLPTYRTGVIMPAESQLLRHPRRHQQHPADRPLLSFAIFFVNVIGGERAGSAIHVSYGNVAISVLIYLGIPLGAGLLTRAIMLRFTSHTFFYDRFLPIFSPLALLGLLYTILVMFAYQGHHILHNLGPVFRVFVPLILYFIIMWTSAFAFIWWCGKKRSRNSGSIASQPVATISYVFCIELQFE
ncbi:Arsenite resistance protein ArsB [Grifola frondosa]|uniref:Arsenite resistance protein ArsB n=1 Tax=Grifola frondosa TaxID=5627 RepID=A0A1C7LTD9_GRIFR|nr:Arsenite resistance protein ArsB [Grifola frondosa]